VSRPSALVGHDVPVPASLTLAEVKRAMRSSRYEMVQALVESRDGEFYSAEIGRELGIPASVAAGALRRMEREGLLSSRTEASPISGLGRRYYRVVT
jgi:predicted transcriptional regulator